MPKNFSISISLTMYKGDGSVLDHVTYDNVNDVDKKIETFEQGWKANESWSVALPNEYGDPFEVDSRKNCWPYNLPKVFED